MPPPAHSFRLSAEIPVPPGVHGRRRTTPENDPLPVHLTGPDGAIVGRVRAVIPQSNGTLLCDLEITDTAILTALRPEVLRGLRVSLPPPPDDPDA